MDMIEAYQRCIKQYAVFSGRARRREYWLFCLCNMLVSLLLSVLARAFSAASLPRGLIMAVSVISLVYSLFILLPGIAVAVRRLHDAGHSGAYYFMVLIPIAGPIILLIALCKDSIPGENAYGPNPKESINQNSDAVSLLRDEPQNELPEESSTVPFDQEAYVPTNKVVRTPTPAAANSRPVRATCMTGTCKGQSAVGEAIYIGRDPSLCQLVLPNVPGVSKVHCMLHSNGTNIEVRDLNSSYGTFLANGTRLESDKSIFLQGSSTIYLGSANVAVAVELVL